MKTVILALFSVFFAANSVSLWLGKMPGLSEGVFNTRIAPAWFFLVSLLLAACAVLSCGKRWGIRWRRLLYLPLGMLLLYYVGMFVWCLVQGIVWYGPVIAALFILIIVYIIYRNKTALESWHNLHE